MDNTAEFTRGEASSVGQTQAESDGELEIIDICISQDLESCDTRRHLCVEFKAYLAMLSAKT